MEDVIDGVGTEMPLEGKAEATLPEFAFLVVKVQGGGLQVNNLPEVDAVREPQIDDIYAAIKIIERDLVVKQTALTVLSTIDEVGKKQAEQLTPEPTNKFRSVKRS